MSNSKNPVRETPVRSFGESEWNDDFYRRYSLESESLEDCKARVNKELHDARAIAKQLPVGQFLQQQLNRRIAIKEELRSNGELEPFEMEGRPVPKDLFFGSQLFDKLPTPELVQRIKAVCKDKPTVVVTPRRPHQPSVFAGSVAMCNEVDVVFSVSTESFKGDTHFAIHQPKKRPEGLQCVQLKQSPKNVFVQLGNGAVYWAANHHHAQTIHRIITAETKQMYAKCYKTWKDNV